MTIYHKILIIVVIIILSTFIMSSVITLLSTNNTIDNISGVVIGISLCVNSVIAMSKIINYKK